MKTTENVKREKCIKEIAVDFARICLNKKEKAFVALILLK